MGKYVIALDQGTTSSRCILFDQQGTICSVAQKEFTQLYPQPGWVEHNPMEIWSSQLSVTMEAMGKIGAHYSDIATQSHYKPAPQYPGSRQSWFPAGL